MKTIFNTAIVFMFAIIPQMIFAHCEIPCGIYDDQARSAMIEEHITTIEKSMKMILELSKAENMDYNQLTRWVQNKDEHASEIQHIVSQYFMTQRIKAADPKDIKQIEKYVKELGLLHEMLVSAMKTKQTTDLAHVEKLKILLSEFNASYFEKHHETK